MYLDKQNSVNSDGGGSHWQRWAYKNRYTNLNLHPVRCEPRVCIRNPIVSHIKNEQEEVKVIYGEYSYYIDKQNSVNTATAAGGSHWQR